MAAGVRRVFTQEWPAPLDVGALLAGGWQPTPFRQFLLKMHTRCNLACDYCYYQGETRFLEVLLFQA